MVGKYPRWDLPGNFSATVRITSREIRISTRAPVQVRKIAEEIA